MGIEAFSRGASRVVLVDHARGAIAAIRRNLSGLDEARGVVEVRRADFRSALAQLSDARMHFDVVFVDPPYTAEYEAILDRVVASGVLAPEAIVIVERFHKRTLPERIGMLGRFRDVRIGDHCLSLYRPWRAAAVEGSEN